MSKIQTKCSGREQLLSAERAKTYGRGGMGLGRMGRAWLRRGKGKSFQEREMSVAKTQGAVN